MRGIYTVSFLEQTIAAASGDYDLFDVAPAANKPIEIVALSLGNKSEIGDAQDEMLSYTITRGYATASNGGATTPRPTDASDGAASFTALAVGATIAAAGAGTIMNMMADTFNVRAGLMLVLPPEMRPKCSAITAETRMTVRLTTAVADDLTLSGTLWVREL